MHLPRIICLLLLPLVFIFNAVAAPNQKPLFETETDPAFVLKLSFRARAAGGTTTLALHNAAGQVVGRLEATAAALSLWRRTGLRDEKVAQTTVAYQRDNTLQLTRDGEWWRVSLNRRYSLTGRLPAAATLRINDPAQRWELVGEPRYQPTEPIFLTDDFMKVPGADAHWQTVSGTWHVAGAANPNDAADPFKLIGFATGPGVTLNTDTRWFWHDYQTEVSARTLDDKAAIGLVFGYEDAANYYALSWGAARAAGADAGTLRLWRRSAGRTVLLAQRAEAARPRQWYRLAVHTLGDTVTAYVDEQPLLTVPTTRFAGGQCGLYVAGEAGAEFDDVRVQSVQGAQYAVAPPRVDHSWADKTFANDQYMASWGSAQALWEKAAAGDVFWYRGQFYNQVHVRVTLLPEEGKAPRSPVTNLVLMGDAADAQAGYVLKIEREQLTLAHGGTTLATAALPRTEEMEAVVRPGAIEVLVGGQAVLRYENKAMALQGRVAAVPSNPTVPAELAEQVAVFSPSMQEYRFDNAPVDWAIEAGEWQSTTRWACVPNWNFFGGRGEPLATVWNKRRYGGDLWIEAFLAPREGTSDWIHFSFPVNLNITFCAENDRLDSGYSLVYQVHDDTTLLYRRGVQVAKSEVMYKPNWRVEPWEVYGRLAETWQHLQIERQGGRIRVWVAVQGNEQNIPRKLLLEYTDPAPLPGDRLALWTWGVNGMSVAQMRIAAQRVGVSGAAAAPSVPSQKMRVAITTAPPTNAPAIKIAVRPKQAVAAAKTSPQPVTISVNPINGGYFRTDLIKGLLPIKKKPVLRFAFKATPKTALALYVVAQGQLFRAPFLGTVTSDHDAVPLLPVRVTPSVNGWSRAEFPLLQALRTHFPSGDLPVVTELFLGDLSTDVGHVSGLEANPKGARLAVQMLPGPPPGAMLPVAWAAPPVKEMPREIVVRLTDDASDPDTVEFALNATTVAKGRHWNAATRTLTLDITQCGLTFRDGQTVKCTVGMGGDLDEWPGQLQQQWLARTAADNTPPGAPVVTTALGPDRISTFDEESSLPLGDDFNWRDLEREQGATLWRDSSTAASGKKSLRLYHRGLTGSFGAVIRDRPFDLRRWPVLTFSYRLHPNVYTSLILEIDGKFYDVRMTEYINNSPYNYGFSFPAIGRIPDLKTDGQWHTAEINLLQAVQATVLRGGGRLGNTVVSRIMFADADIMNNVQDVYWHVDDVRFVPALPVGEATKLSWSAADSSGIAGYSYVFDNAPGTEPPATAQNVTTASIPANTSWLHVRACDAAGNWGETAHFRFVPYTAAPTLAAPVVAAPVVAEVSGAATKTLPAPTVEVRLAASTPAPAVTVPGVVAPGTRPGAPTMLNLDIDWETLRWQVTAAGGEARTYGLSGGEPATATLVYDAARGVLRWRDAALTGKDGKAYPLTAKLTAQSLTGKPILNQEWQWTVNPAADTATPPAPFVTYVPTNRLQFSDFEKGWPAEVSLRRSTWNLPERRTAGTGQNSVRVVNLLRSDFFGIYMRNQGWRVDQYPLVSFDYRFEAMPGRFNMNLVAMVNGDMQLVNFTGSNNERNEAFMAALVGKMDDTKTDGTWNHAGFDLGAMLRKRYPTTPRFYADTLGTWAAGAWGYNNPAGASLWLDNIAIYSPKATTAGFNWSEPAAPNGIRGYAYTLDQNAATVPAETITTTGLTADFKDLKPGTWYFHVRACDNAGRWGPAAHSKFDLEAP